MSEKLITNNQQKLSDLENDEGLSKLIKYNKS